VEWLEGPASPTYWERGPRPNSVHTQPMVKLKNDNGPRCGADGPDFCLCISGLPEYVHSVEYNESDESDWLFEGVTPRSSHDEKWIRAVRRFNDDWVRRADEALHRRVEAEKCGEDFPGFPR